MGNLVDGLMMDICLKLFQILASSFKRYWLKMFFYIKLWQPFCLAEQKGLVWGLARLHEAVGLMLQSPVILAFPETNYEFVF